MSQTQMMSCCMIPATEPEAEGARWHVGSNELGGSSRHVHFVKMLRGLEQGPLPD